ncbi:chorismate-binding protein [Bacillaceae bacterium W0354]
MDKQIIHFKHDLLGNEPLLFQHAIDFVVARSLAEVKSALKKIEAYAKQGFYAVGYVSYEAAKAFDSNMDVHEQVELPFVYFGIYEKKDVYTSGQNSSSVKLEYVPDTPRPIYDDAIKNIHQAIRDGATNQVNYTIRLNADYEDLSTEAYYQQLANAQKANFTSHLRFEDFEIISISPELFFAWDGKTIETKPMKGTIKRGRSVEEDIIRKEQLRSSNKDKNENKMIVDLLRAELSQVAKPGTVSVKKRFEIETYPTVFQMTSTVKADTKEGTSLLSIFEALFPCGSITGSPKICTMQLIKELEKTPREVYCGAIGIVTPEQNAIFSVPIRTVWLDHKHKRATYGVGGGITAASSAESEYNELLAKSEVLKYEAPDFELLETMKLDDGEVFLLDKHLFRLKQSAQYFNISFSESELPEKLSNIEEKYSNGTFLVRVLLSKSGQIEIEIKEINLKQQTGKVALAKRPINRDLPFHYHKTTYRDIYEQHKIMGVYDTLLWNEEGYITEFINGNVVYQLDGHQYTPPIHDGLLPGTFREMLLENGEIVERSLHKDELNQVEKLWFINSVREWVEVVLV